MTYFYLHTEGIVRQKPDIVVNTMPGGAHTYFDGSPYCFGWWHEEGTHRVPANEPGWSIEKRRAIGEANALKLIALNDEINPTPPVAETPPDPVNPPPGFHLWRWFCDCALRR